MATGYLKIHIGKRKIDQSLWSPRIFFLSNQITTISTKHPELDANIGAMESPGAEDLAAAVARKQMVQMPFARNLLLSASKSRFGRRKSFKSVRIKEIETLETLNLSSWIARITL